MSFIEIIGIDFTSVSSVFNPRKFKF